MNQSIISELKCNVDRGFEIPNLCHGVGRTTTRYLENICGTLKSPIDFRVHFSYKYKM